MVELNSEMFVKLAVDAARGKLVKYDKNQADKSIRNAFIDLLGTDKPGVHEFRRHKLEIFEIIEEVLSQTITDGFATPFFDQFVEGRDVAIGDRQDFYVPDNTPLVVSKHAGNHWDIRAQKFNIGDTFFVSTTPYAVRINGDFLRFLSGRLDWAQLVAKVSSAFQEQIKNDIYDSFLATINYLPEEFRETGTFDQTKLLTLAAHVQASNQSSNVVLAGTKVALSCLTDVTTLSDGEKRGLNQNGIVDVWKGYPLLPITQSHKPGTFEFQITDDRIFVMPSGPKPIKLVHEGRPFMKEITDGKTNMDMSLDYEFMDRYGIATIFNSLYGQYDIGG